MGDYSYASFRLYGVTDKNRKQVFQAFAWFDDWNEEGEFEVDKIKDGELYAGAEIRLDTCSDILAELPPGIALDYSQDPKYEYSGIRCLSHPTLGYAELETNGEGTSVIDLDWLTKILAGSTTIEEARARVEAETHYELLTFFTGLANAYDKDEYLPEMAKLPEIVCPYPEGTGEHLAWHLGYVETHGDDGMIYDGDAESPRSRAYDEGRTVGKVALRQEPAHV